MKKNIAVRLLDSKGVFQFTIKLVPLSNDTYSIPFVIKSNEK